MSPGTFGVTNDIPELSHRVFPVFAFSREPDTVEGSVACCVPPSNPVGMRGHAWFEDRAAGCVDVSEETICRGL